MMYQEQWCFRCVNCDGCPIWDIHLLHNHDQHRNKEVASILGMLIPRSEGGLDNEKCTMFMEANAVGDLFDGEAA